METIENAEVGIKTFSPIPQKAYSIADIIDNIVPMLIKEITNRINKENLNKFF